MKNKIIKNGILTLFLASGVFAGENKEVQKKSGAKEAFISMNVAIGKNDVRGMMDNYYFYDIKGEKAPTVDELYKQLTEHFKNKEELIERVKEEFKDVKINFSNYEDLSKRIYVQNLTPRLSKIFYDKKTKAWAIKIKDEWKIHEGVRGEMDFEYMNWSLDRIVGECEKYKSKKGYYPEYLSDIDGVEVGKSFMKKKISDLTVDYFNGNNRIYRQYVRGDWGKDWGENPCKGSDKDFIMWSFGPDNIDDHGRVEYDSKTKKGDLVRYSGKGFFEKYKQSECR